VKTITVNDILDWTSGALLCGKADTEVTDVSTDSRKGCMGSLFVALRGENFDGHDFVRNAVEKGAVAVISERSMSDMGSSASIAFIEVQDTLRAFQDLAAGYRRQFAPTIVAITGSNGKTTTKEFARSVAASKFRTTATQGTENNQIGLPRSLLSIGPETTVGVFEIGMSSPGEIRNLAQIAAPCVGVITNVCPAHTEFFRSVEEVALAKSELLEVLNENGAAVLNADDSWFGFLKQRARSRILSFAMENPADVCGASVRRTTEGMVFRVAAAGRETECSIRAFGRHNVYNALAAIAVGLELGVGLDQSCSALSETCLPDMRFQFERIGDITVINDAYNANPTSTIAALDALDEIESAGRRIILLGDMLELGWYSSEGHRRVGKRVSRSGAEVLITVGKMAQEIADTASEEGFIGGILKVDSAEEAAEILRETVVEGDTIFVKGSRAVKLESVIDLLRKDKLIESP
jgi:UDP-N-acetylmuramoyl-tripeptide--D-alanyl-D-alanine ligase